VKTAVILLGHGSQADGGNVALREVADIIEKTGGLKVIPAYLQFCEPSLPQAIEKAVADGAGKIVVMPYFLYMGNHVSKDIPEELGMMRAKYPGVEMIMTGHLGAHPKLAEIVMERIKGKV
jgi:sirohydrochlorin ferrochelatase